MPMKCNVDCSVVTGAAAMHRVLAQALNFPEWYGHNLDALFDCLTELEEPVHLVLENWDADAPYAEGFACVFADAREENPDFIVEFL